MCLGGPQSPPAWVEVPWSCQSVSLSWQEEVATAWKVLRTEPIVLRLRFSLSQYLDGPGEWGQEGCSAPMPLGQAGCGVPVPLGQAQWCTDSSSSSLPTEPSIEVFQPSNKEGFGLGLQLKK